MDEDPKQKALDELRAALPECEFTPVEDAPLQYVPSGDAARDLFEQIERGIWPIRMPFEVELSPDGLEPRVRVRDDQQPRSPSGRVIRVDVVYDRDRAHELLLTLFHSWRGGRASKLPLLLLLERVNRPCFLETAAGHFVELLAEGDEALRQDRLLVLLLRDLDERDPGLVAQMVGETMRRDRTTGTRLRDVILDTLDRPDVRELLGWLVTASIADRLREL